VLDGLRGIAVLLVIAEHSELLHNGFMGVDLFFVLSGFLITTLLCEEWERRGRISLKGFYIRRARRLLPALAVLAILAILVELFSYPMTGWGLGAKLASTFGFINNWVAGLGNSADLGALNPTWSLAQEEQFYLLWPVALVLLLHWRVKPGQIVLLLAAAIGSVLWFEPAIAGHMNQYSDYYDPIDRAAELLLGCLTSLVWRHRMLALAEASAPGAGLTGWRRGVAELVGLALVFGFVWLLLKALPVDSRWVFLGAAGLAAPGLVLLLQVPGTLVGRCVSAAPLRFIGRVSYSLYLIHLLVRNVLFHVVSGLKDPWWIAALTLLASLALATLSHHFIESPVRSGRWPVPLTWLIGRVPALGRAGEPQPETAQSEGASPRTGSPIRSTA
jgi:peptidoglycan/LPS O-acetylase OafA/YrhL